MSWTDIARELGISVESVIQIAARAAAKVRRFAPHLGEQLREILTERRGKDRNAA